MYWRRKCIRWDKHNHGRGTGLARGESPVRSLCQHVSRKRDEMGKADLGSVLLGVGYELNGENTRLMINFDTDINE